MLSMALRVLAVGLILIQGDKTNTAVGLIVTHGASTCGCSLGWMTYKGSSYKVFEQKKTWSEAQKTCQGYGANLATILDSGVNNALAALLPPLYWYVDKQAWIGLNDRVTEGTYIWLETNRRATWTNWDDGEPNNRDFGNEDCIALMPEKYWNDAPCSTRLKFICEKSV